ncbi:MAG: glycosyltransferase [Candidatus Binatia bacterium]
MNRLVYIVNTRLPTEKAHGYQICKMSEAFAHHGVAVLLLHPYRHQPHPSPALCEKTIFDYYGLSRVFAVKTLPNLDITRVDRFLRRSMFTPLFFVHAVLWGLYAARVARREQADLYYTRDSAVAYWLLRLGLPTAYEVHEIPRRARQRLLQRVAQHPALRLMVVKTSFIKHEVVHMGFPGEKILVLANGVDVPLFANLPSRQACREQLGLPQDRPIIGYMGRFQTMGMEKGIPELVHLMACLPPLDGKEPLLLCVGGPLDAVPAYQALARRWGVPAHRLRFVDRVPNQEVPTWIAAYDVAVAPFPATAHYIYFMSPLKLFEYMAAGVPIVASDLPSIREVLTDKENALLVRPGDLHQWSETIVRLLKDPALGERLTERASRDVRRYTWKGQAHTILSRVGAP